MTDLNDTSNFKGSCLVADPVFQLLCLVDQHTTGHYTTYNTVPQISHQVHHQVWLLFTGLCGYYPPRHPRLTSHSSISRPIRAVDALIILPELATEISNKTFTIVFSEPFAREQNNLTKWPSWRMVCGQRECKGNLE